MRDVRKWVAIQSQNTSCSTLGMSVLEPSGTTKIVEEIKQVEREKSKKSKAPINRDSSSNGSNTRPIKRIKEGCSQPRVSTTNPRGKTPNCTY